MPLPSSRQQFVRKFGEDFLPSLPRCPGVYLVFDGEDRVIYVGKAKNLRRRLGQYKNARRRKKHAKMRAIVAEAARIEIRTLPTDLEACLEETRLIQSLRPKWNVAGAFFFLYPMIGSRWRDGVARFCYTTQPELYPGFDFHGAFRSREITREAFFALMSLLGYVGHRVRRPSLQAGNARRSYVVEFRQLPEGLVRDWSLFWMGESPVAMENLVLALVENAGARRKTREIQESLDLIRRFWRHEAKPLRRALDAAAWASYPVPQRERDIVFLHARDQVVLSHS